MSPHLDYSYFSDLKAFRKYKLQYPKNSVIGYLNINSLRNKIFGLWEIMSGKSLDYFVVSKTKLGSSFPSAKFHINEYKVNARSERDKNGGRLIKFVRKGFIYKRLKKLEPKSSEVICWELTISNKKLIFFSVYRPPNQDNLDCFLNELTTSLSEASKMYDNFLVMGHFNIDVSLPSH